MNSIGSDVCSSCWLRNVIRHKSDLHKKYHVTRLLYVTNLHRLNWPKSTILTLDGHLCLV